MNQIVSVVVPIYKVEKYLSRCVDSILQQTYKNLEIILVNDGSPDNCGIIADQYAKEDKRVKAVHKENGGLSDARNYGMRYVTGEFTLFVDSDDWLEQKMIQELVQASYKYQADIVQAAFYYAYDDHLLFDSRVYKKDKEPESFDNKTLMYQLVKNEKVKNFAWGKLYKTNLIKDIPFKKGVLFEDVFWAHLVMQRVNTFISLNNPMYFYYQREDSIVANYTTRNLDFIQGLKERHRFIEKHYPYLVDESYKMILKMNLIHYNLLLRNRKKDTTGLYRKEIQQYIKKQYPILRMAVMNEKVLKKQLLLFNLHPYLNVLFLVGKKLLTKVSIIPQPTGLDRVEM
ncbi:glycosyltransferase family 2 protein [Neobacillus drentensis]|uniref:glycosyltransferase family 2 protein n=1 Tax=Neobacillus drentensis TaxID=220684 RepID=UPI002FFFB5AC